MNKDDFIKLIGTPGPYNRNVLGELSALINVFPYFQSAHMLLLKGLQKTADVKFENQLRSSAMRIASREVLYSFLSNEPVPATEKKIPEFPAKSTEHEGIETEQVVIEMAKNSEDLITEIEKDESQDKSDHLSKGYSIIITAESGDKESDASLVVINEESGEIEEKVVYMDPGFSVYRDEDLLELDTGHDNFSESDEKDILQEKEEVKVMPSPKQIQSELIDRFIIANPRIEPVKVQIDEPVIDISKPFTEEKEEYLTETLARIYTKQGYYSKAINIYESLSLKYPEKSSYFAALILEVQELIKK